MIREIASLSLSQESKGRAGERAAALRFREEREAVAAVGPGFRAIFLQPGSEGK
jgi:hypothetical protein